MPEHKETRVLPYNPDFLYDLVLDIERYPEFLPWCLACRIKKSEPEYIEAEMAVGYKMFRETFLCTVHFDQDKKTIDVDYISGPLKKLENKWSFAKHDNSSCKIDFFINYEFQSYILQKILDSFFDIAFKKMVFAFEKRAKSLNQKK